MTQIVITDKSVTDEPKPPSTFEAVEKIGKIIVAVLAVSYAIGMIVSNQYLLALGTSDFTSVRPKYVLTGCWVLLMMLLASLPVLLPLLACNRFDKRALLLAVLGIIFCAMIGGLFLYFLHFDFQWRNEKAEVIKAAINMVLVIWFCTVMLTIGVRKLRLIQPGGPQYMGFIIVAVISCSLFGQVTTLTSKHIYGHIPEAMGGGKAVFAIILLNDKGVEFWGQFIPLHPRPLTTAKRAIQPVNILYQDEKVLVIEIEQERPDLPNLHLTTKTLVLKRELVDGIYVDSDANRL